MAERTDDTATLWLAFQAGERGARDRLILHYHPWVLSLARAKGRRLPANIDIDDLVSRGMVALIVRIDRFDPDRGIDFEHYAFRGVTGAISDEIRDTDVPRPVRAAARRAHDAREELTSKLRRQPSRDELEVELGEPLVSNQWTTAPVSLDAGVATRRDHVGRHSGFYGEDAPQTVADMLADRDTVESLSAVEDLRRRVIGAVLRLADRDKHVLARLYIDEYTFAELGDELGIKPTTVSYLRDQAIRRLRKLLAVG